MHETRWTSCLARSFLEEHEKNRTTGQPDHGTNIRRLLPSPAPVPIGLRASIVSVLDPERGSAAGRSWSSIPSPHIVRVEPAAKVVEYRFFFDHLGFEIPYRSLGPADLDNVLLAGRCISASQPAFQSARSMAPNMAISQAAGTAAAMCVSRNCMPAELDVTALQAKLEQDGAVVRVPRFE